MDQPGEVHELGGYLHRAERELQRLEEPVRPAQDRHVPPRDPVRVERVGAFGEVLVLVDQRLVLVRVAVRQLKRQMMPALKLEPSALAEAAGSRRQPS